VSGRHFVATNSLLQLSRAENHYNASVFTPMKLSLMKTPEVLKSMSNAGEELCFARIPKIVLWPSWSRYLLYRTTYIRTILKWGNTNILESCFSVSFFVLCCSLKVQTFRKFYPKEALDWNFIVGLIWLTALSSAIVWSSKRKLVMLLGDLKWFSRSPE